MVQAVHVTMEQAQMEHASCLLAAIKHAYNAVQALPFVKIVHLVSCYMELAVYVEWVTIMTWRQWLVYHVTILVNIVMVLKILNAHIVTKIPNLDIYLQIINAFVFKGITK